MKTNTVALITGAAARLGKIIALALAERGLNVAITYFHADEPWQETCTELAHYGVEVMALQLDVRQHDQPRACVETIIERWGRLDILVNNASVWLQSNFLDIDLAAWETALDVNLTGPFLCAQAAAPHMLRQGHGVIINMADLSAFQTWPGYAHHAASKAGLITLTKVMAAELAPTIRVNAIAPGTVLLPDNASPAKRQWAIENSLLKRIGSPEDVARMVCSLIDMDFTTGAVYFVDGGRALV